MNTDYSDIDEAVISNAIVLALALLIAILTVAVFLSPIIWS